MVGLLWVNGSGNIDGECGVILIGIKISVRQPLAIRTAYFRDEVVNLERYFAWMMVIMM
jgi:hypothetical protein